MGSSGHEKITIGVDYTDGSITITISQPADGPDIRFANSTDLPKMQPSGCIEVEVARNSLYPIPSVDCLSIVDSGKKLILATRLSRRGLSAAAASLQICVGAEHGLLVARHYKHQLVLTS